MNKFHRYNHHSVKNPSIPDAGYDPIASHEFPFRGEFVLSGQLSAFSPSDYYSILTNHLYSQSISAEDIQVTDRITAKYMDVEYIDVTVAETSGFMISGSRLQSDYVHVPIATWNYDVLTLNYVGLSSNAWASFGADVKIAGDLTLNGGLTASGSLTVDDLTVNGCLSTDCINSSSGMIYINSNVTVNDNISAGFVSVETIRANNWLNYPSLTTNSLVINVRDGWYPMVSETRTLGSGGTYKYAFDDNTVDRMVIVTVNAIEYTSYGEIYGMIGPSDDIMCFVKVGNMGLLPNANVEHALQSDLWIDNSQTFTMLVPSGYDWKISAANVYLSSVNVDIKYMQQKMTNISVIGSELNVVNITASNLTVTNQILMDTSTMVFNSSSIALSGNITQTSFVNPVTADGWLVFNINGTPKAIRLYDFTT